MTAPVRISNAEARRLFLERHALAGLAPGKARGDDLAALVQRLGFVQLDSINTVARAHHMILFARRPAYRPKALAPLLARDRAVFEHWTHDASIIPTAFYPHWHLRFRRDRERLRARWKAWQRHEFEERFDEILARIRADGPVCSSDVGAAEEKTSGGWWNWHPSKTALEFLWRSGALAVTHRSGFQKHYDLAERVIPAHLLARVPDEAETVDWCCRSALERLGFATPGEIAAFWATVTPQEAKHWCDRASRRDEIIEAEIEDAMGRPRRVVAAPDVLREAREAAEPTARLRVLSPFDPAIRDRKRTERLFGFHYRIEVFVPEAQRRYGYYVFPLLEGARLVGRIDMKAYRPEQVLRVRRLWLEPNVRLGRGRLARLEAELERVRRFSGCDRVEYLPGWRDDLPG